MSSANETSVTVVFDPTAINKQSDVIGPATSQKAGVMSAAQAAELASIVAGTVSSVSGTAPIVSTGGLNPDVSITPATPVAAGSMSAADKAKLNGITPGAAVASVSGTAPIVSSGGATPAISITPATTLAPGSLSAADKAKVDALTYRATIIWSPGKTSTDVYAELVAAGGASGPPGGIVLIPDSGSRTWLAGTYDLSCTKFVGVSRRAVLTFAANVNLEGTAGSFPGLDITNALVTVNGTMFGVGAPTTKFPSITLDQVSFNNVGATPVISSNSALVSIRCRKTTMQKTGGGAIVDMTVAGNTVDFWPAIGGYTSFFSVLPNASSITGVAGSSVTLFPDALSAVGLSLAVAAGPTVNMAPVGGRGTLSLPSIPTASLPAAGASNIGSSVWDETIAQPKTSNGAAYKVIVLEPTLGAILDSTGVNVTISPTTRQHHVSNAGSIQTINLPWPGFTGALALIPNGVFTLVTGGNIALAATAVVGRTLYVEYDGTSWYPSY